MEPMKWLKRLGKLLGALAVFWYVLLIWMALTGWVAPRNIRFLNTAEVNLYFNLSTLIFLIDVTIYKFIKWWGTWR